VLTAATGTALFATLSKDHASQTLRLVLGLVSVLAAVLAALQTFLGFGQRADKHRTTAAAYGSIRREIEQYQALGPSSRDQLEQMMAKLRSRLDEVSGSAPDLPNRSWAKAQSEIADTARPEGFRRSGAARK
jgi:type II secretory pathway pseudopilin PulG